MAAIWHIFYFNVLYRAKPIGQPAMQIETGSAANQIKQDSIAATHHDPLGEAGYDRLSELMIAEEPAGGMSNSLGERHRRL